MANIMEEREKEKNEMQKKAEMEKKEAKLRAKIAKYKNEENKGEANEEVDAQDDDDGFTTIEDKDVSKARNNNQKQWQNNNQQQNWRGRGGYNQRGGRGGYTQNQQSGVPGQHAKLLKTTKKAQRMQAYWQSTQVKPLRCNLRDNSIDVKPEWALLEEFTK